MEKTELLAPAQNLNTAIAAINSGADAVYIGAESFGARKNASNSIEDIKKAVDFAHLFNAKVYVTLNTILTDEELIKCEQLIKELYEIKVDAIIIQDFGILKLAIENKIPPIMLHISTQCDIRTPEKVKFFEDIGIKRVILARELPLNKIEEIRKTVSLELEHFIHGALCVSYSGQCYLSCFIGQRSANRGECAQACRKKYSLVDSKGNYIAKNKYLLSLKDNNLSKHLNKLIKAGVTSFKIEGRLKDKNYVKNTVLYYHNLLSGYPRVSCGKIVSDFEPNVQKSFNRGFCDDYLFNKKDNIYDFISPKSKGELTGRVISSSIDSFTIRPLNKTIEINPGDGLCFVMKDELTGCLVNKSQKVKEGIKIFPNKKINLQKNLEIYRNIDVKFNKTLENTKTKRKLEVEFMVYENKLVVKDTRSNKVELGFEANEKAQNKDKMKNNFVSALSKTGDLPYFVSNVSFRTLEVPFLPVSQINELRRTILEKLSEKILERYKVKKQKPLDIAQFPISEGDYRMNIHNKSAKDFCGLCGCEITEMSFESLKNPKNKELMRTKHCLKKAFTGCDNPEPLFLVDEKGVRYPLIFDCGNCEMTVCTPD